MWRFVLISDPHLGVLENGAVAGRDLSASMPDVLRCLRSDLARLNPEFLLVMGDISCCSSRDAVFAARDLLDSLKVPYYPMGGDRDFLVEAARGWFLDAFQAQLPVRDTVYSFTHKGLHICVLDPWWQWPDETLCPFAENGEPAGGWAIPPHQFDWLEDDLNVHKDAPTVVAMHYPAVPAPARLHPERLPHEPALHNGVLLTEVLANHRQVKAVFSGHARLHYAVQENGLIHVVTGPLSEFPMEFREVHVYDDRLEIHTRGLSDQTFAAHMKAPRDDWPTGESADREAVIPLTVPDGEAAVQAAADSTTTK
jgi:3',5'-cyclic AMP phosphodiesterase CpdA